MDPILAAILREALVLGIKAGFDLVRNGAMTAEELDATFEAEKIKFMANTPDKLEDPQ